MRYVWIGLAVFFITVADAQDTLQLVKYYDKTKTFWLVSKTDTIMYSCYPSGKKESERKYNSNGKTILYKRWYENGKLMWEKETVNGISQGKTVFYNNKGVKVAELLYEKGEIADTVYVKENTHLVLGKITSRSIVYGGMVREDGTSNVSDHSGPWLYCDMYAAKFDSLKKPEMIQYYRSDHNGEFFILAPEGKVGFFQKSTPIDKLSPGEYYPVSGKWSSGHYSWRGTGPLIVTAEDQLLLVHLHYESVGYAP